MTDWTIVIHSCTRCGASWYAPRDEPHECIVEARVEEAIRTVIEELRTYTYIDHNAQARHPNGFKAAADHIELKFGAKR